jgi:hypothetical protein
MNYTIDIDVDRRIMIAKIYGIWKREIAEEYRQEYVETAEPLLGKPWARLTNLTNWKSSYPDIVEILGEHMRWCLDNGAALSVYIIDNPVTRNQLQRMVESGKAGSITKLFKTFEEGDKFLKNNGF